MKYTITDIRDSDGWIFISAENSFEEPDAFAALLKEIAAAVDGRITSLGHTQYRILNLPYDLVFQWDDLFGIVVINNSTAKTGDVIQFLKTFGIS